MASVLVVDDDAGIRESAAIALQKVGHRTQQASDALSAQRLIREHRFDVVVSDIYMPGEDGIALLQAIAERRDPPRVILMTARGTIETTAIAHRAGAFDYLAKPFVLEELLARVQHLVRRSHVMPRTLAERLTPRESEILRYLTIGMDHLDIARELVLAPKTIEKHIEHILLKLGVHSRAQAIAVAFRDAPSVGSRVEVAPFRQSALRERSEV